MSIIGQTRSTETGIERIVECAKLLTGFAGCFLASKAGLNAVSSFVEGKYTRAEVCATYAVIGLAVAYQNLNKIQILRRAGSDR